MCLLQHQRDYMHKFQIPIVKVVLLFTTRLRIQILKILIEMKKEQKLQNS